MSDERCPCCPNHCDKDNLSCHRGQEYFNNPNTKEEPTTLEECIIAELRKCGHMLHHNRDLNPVDMLADFDEEELRKFHELLSKICN